MDLDDILGGGKKTPPNYKFVNVGDEVTLRLTQKAKGLQVREFTGRVPGEFLFWQNKKVVRQSDLNTNLPYDPVKQILFVGVTKDGEEFSIWADGEKLKASVAATREANYFDLDEGTLVNMKLTELKDTGAPYPKKLYAAKIKAPKE